MGLLDFATIQENMTCAIGKNLYFWSPYVLKLRHFAVKGSKLQLNLLTRPIQQAAKTVRTPVYSKPVVVNKKKLLINAIESVWFYLLSTAIVRKEQFNILF